MKKPIEQKLDFTQERITSLIINNIPKEKIVADDLFRKGITEGEFFQMQDDLKIDKPTIIRIGNHLRDNWRTRGVS